MVKWTVNCCTLFMFIHFHVSFVRSLAPSRCWLQGACGGKDSFFTGRERLELWSNTSKRMLWYFGGTWTKVREITVYFIMKQQSYCSLSPKNCTLVMKHDIVSVVSVFPSPYWSFLQWRKWWFQFKWTIDESEITSWLSFFFSFRNILEHCLNCYGEITDMDSDTG